MLCRVGQHRLALEANDVVLIDDGQAGAPYAGRGFEALAITPAVTRRLRAATWALLVDSVEMAPEPPSLLRVPPALGGTAGGALRGFVHWAGELWPVVSFEAFARYLGAA